MPPPSVLVLGAALLLLSWCPPPSGAAPNLLSHKSLALPSSSVGSGFQEMDLAAIFNRVAQESTAAPPVSTAPPPTTPPPTSTTQPPATTTVSNSALHPFTPNPDTNEFVSKSRSNPPLPPGYANPFADKAILRGSQSEGPATGSNRRQLLPPPPPPIRIPSEMERIPIRPPDLAPTVVDKKFRPLNTPAEYRPDVINSSSDTKNDTTVSEPEVQVPLLQSPAVTRILSENAARPEDERRNNSSSRVLLDLVNKDSMIDVQAPTLPSNDPSEDTPRVVTDPPRSYPVPQWPSHLVGGVTWDVIVYTLASLFILLALYAFFICPFRASDSLITRGAYITLHLFLFAIGVSRGGYLFYDAYNMRNSFPPLVDRILLDLSFPCIFSAFTVLFYALANITKVQLCHSRAQSPAVLLTGLVLNLVIFVGLEWAAHTLDLIKFLVAALRALPLLPGLSVIAGFLIAFRCLYSAARRLQGDVLRANFAKMGALPRRPQLKLASRLILAAAILIIALCGVQLYALFGFYSASEPLPWPWWSCQLAARVLELCVCALLAATGWLRRTGVPTKLSLCCCLPSPDSKSADDLFPAICSKNNAIHNYSLHTGKPVYEGTTNKGTSPYVAPPTMNTMPMGSLKRTAIKCGTMPANPRDPSKRHHHNSYGKGAVKSSSMLFAEDGVVRFRTVEDPAQHMQEVLHRSLTRHEALTAFNGTVDAHMSRHGRNRSGSLGDLRVEEQYNRSMGRPPRGGQRIRMAHHQPPDSPERSSLSGCSSSDLSESDLTSGGYERVRTSCAQPQQPPRRNNNVRNHRYKAAS